MENTMAARLWDKTKARIRAVLSRKDEFGNVLLRQGGVIEIQARGQAVQLSESEYWKLMEMLSEASMRLMDGSVRLKQ
jgi:hypothetical protein